MKRLGRYVLITMAWHVLLTLVILLGLFVFFDLIGELRDIGKGNYQFHHALVYVMLEAPSRAYELLPVSALIGSIFALSGLADTSQITVMRAAGVSIARFGSWLLVGGIVFGGITYALGEYLVPAGNEAAKRYQVAAKDSVMYGRFRSGVWVKDGLQIVNISAMQPDMTLQALRIYVHDNSHHLSQIIDAQSGRHQSNGQWQLNDVVLTQFSEPKVELKRLPTYLWQSQLEPKMLAVLMIKPQDMSIQSLRQYVEHLEVNKQSTVRYELALWAKLFYPVACLAMMLIALPFALGQRRSGGVGMKIFLGILLGVSFNFINQMMSYIGELYSLPPVLSAALPTLTLATLAVYFLYRQEHR